MFQVITSGARLLRHEYGHYRQSQRNGWAYLPKYGIPSAAGADWTEDDAELRSNTYFMDNYGSHSTSSNPNNFFIIPPGTEIRNARWWEHILVFGGGYIIGGSIVGLLNLNGPR